MNGSNPTQNRGSGGPVRRIPVWRSLRWNLILVSVLITVVPALLVGYLLLTQARERITDQVVAQLQSVTTLKENQLRQWLAQNSNSLDLTAASVTGWLAPQLARPNFGLQQTTEPLSGILGDVVLVTPGFTEMFVYDLDGRIVASSNDVSIGKVVRRQPYYDASLLATHLEPPFFQIGNELTMVGTRQIYGANGEVIAILSGAYSLDTLSAIMLERSGLGNTGETYLVSAESNYLLTPSRFEGFDQLRAYHSTGIDAALNGESGTGIFPDYRGVTVISVYNFVPELNAGFLAEIDEDEGLLDYRNLVQIGAFTVIAATAMAVVIAVGFATRMSRPITQLTQSASRFAAGDLKARSDVKSRNEIGLLSDTFNDMTEQIQELVSGLEGRVSSRTRDLSATLEVGRLATSIYSREELLPRLVEFIRANFGLYYAQIYLLDEAQRYAILRSGTGEVGRELLARQHRLDLSETSLVARAVQTRQHVLVSDTLTSSLHKSNDLLPATRSEITIPLIYGDVIVGVLDMQADRADTFNEDNQSVFLAMASQIAAVLNSARAYDEARSATERAEAVNQRLTAASWKPYLGKLSTEGRVGYEYDLESPKPLHAPLNGAGDVDAAQPVVLRGQQIGKIVIKDDHEREWSSEEKLLIRDVSTRLATALDQFRAFDETQSALAQTEVLYAGSEAVNRAVTLQETLDAIIHSTAIRTMYRTNIQLFNEPWLAGGRQPDYLEVAAVWESTGSDPLEPIGTRYEVAQFPVVQTISRSEPTLFEDAATDPRFDPDARAVLVDQLGMHAFLVFPLTIGDEWIGYITTQAKEVTRFSDEQIRQITTLTSQAAVKVASIRAFEETRRALGQTEVLYAGSDAVNRATSLQETLDAIIDNTFIRTMHRANVQIFNEPWLEGAPAPHHLEVSAVWEGTGGDPLEPVGTRYEVAIFPVVQTISRSEPTLFEDAGTDPRFDPAAKAVLVDQLGMHAFHVFPLTLGNQWIGYVTVQNKEVTALTEDQIRQASALSSQAAVKIASIRAFETTQRALAQSEVLYAGSDAVNRATNLQETLDAIVRNTPIGQMDRANIQLFNEPWIEGSDHPAYVEVVSVWEHDGGAALEALGTHYNVATFPVIRAINRSEPTLFEDVANDPRVDPASKAVVHGQLGINSFFIFSFTIGNQWIGYITAQSRAFVKLNDEQIRQIIALTSQAAVKIQTIRLVTDVTARAADLQTVSELGTAAATILDTETLLQTVSDLTRERFGLYHAHIYLMDDAGQNLILTAGAGEAGRIMREQGRTIVVSREDSLVASAARTRSSVVANDVRSASNFLPNPLLPDTRSELATPLIVGDFVVGVLDVQADTVDRFTEADVQIQSTLASQVAVAVQNARQFELSQRRLVNLEVSNQVNDIIRNSTKDLEGMLEEVLLLATTALGATNAIMTDYVPDDDAWRGLVGVGEGVTTEFAKTVYEPAYRIPHAVEALRLNQPIPIEDAATYPDFPREYIELLNIRSVMAVPITTASRGRSVVYFNYIHTPRRFRADDVNLARSISSQISVGIERKLAENQVQLYVDVVSNSPIGFYVWRMEDINDPHSFRLMAANEASYAATGVKPEGIIGRKMTEVFPGLYDTPIPDLYAGVIRSGQPVELGEVEYGADGVRPSIFAVRAFPLPGNACGVSFENITARKQQENEQSVLYQMSTALTNTRTPDDLLQAITIYTQQSGVSTASLMFVDNDDQGQPEWIELTSSWNNPDLAITPTQPVGTRYYLPHLPFTRLWLGSPHQPTLIDDVTTHPSIDATTRSYMAVDQRGMAVLPLFTQGRWAAVMIFIWPQPMNFTEADERILGTIMRQATSTADALRSAQATRRAREQAEMLSAINAALSQAADENEILAAIATYLQPYGFSLGSLNYFVNDAARQPTHLNMQVLRSGEGEEIPLNTLPASSFRVEDYPLLSLMFENPYEPLFIEDMYSDPRTNEPLRAMSQAMSVNGSIMLPLRTADQWQGVVSFSWTETRTFDSSMRDILTALVPSISAVVASRRAFIAAQNSRDEVERVYNSSIDLIGSAGFDGYFKTLNPAWSHTLGWTLDELKAEPFVSFVHPEDVQLTNDEAAKIGQGVTAISFINRYRCSDGSYRWISWNAAPDMPNALIHFVARDITQTRAAEDEIAARARQLETVAEVGHQIAGNLDVDQLLWSVCNLTRENFNRYHVQIYLLDTDAQNLDLASGSGDIGRKLVERGHHIPVNRENSLVARAARSQRSIIINDVALEDGFMGNPMLPDTRSEMAVPIMLGSELIGVLDIQDSRTDAFTNIDVQVKTVLANQVAVAVQNARAFEFQRGVADRLRDLDRLKSEFLANMSHELRTPLNSIIGYSEVLLDGIDGDLTDDAVEDVKAIHGSGQHLLNIINDILDLAKIEGGQMRVDQKALNLADFIREIANAAQILVKSKPVELLVVEHGKLDAVYADPIRLRQIMWNLISNAVKFTEQGSVTVEIGLNENNMAQVSVTDTGVGMKPDDLEKLFERFRQVDGSSTRRAGGTGLGLHITRHLVRMHGGEIDVNSSFGQGSTFWFTLPLYIEERVKS